MTPWRFEGVPFLPNDRNNGCGRGYLACGCGEVAGWGEADGAGAAEPDVVGAGAAAAACGWADGLIQQAWTRSLKLFGTLSSI